jgi:hypothetical protein
MKNGTEKSRFFLFGGCMSKTKRVLVIADMHCGHVVGLTPPEHHWLKSMDRYHKIQIKLWQYYSEILDKIRPIDILIVNGDSIDGRGERSGSRELITTDRRQQVKMACDCINFVEAEKIVLTYGTPYHVGNEEDWEDQIADGVDAVTIGGHEFIDVNGLIFDVKHKIGSSTIPHGRHTPIAKEKLWNIMWREKKNQPDSNVIIRSHVHYFDYCGASNWLGMTTPALQGLGSMYGKRQCSGTVDWGLVWFDVNSQENFTWKAEIVEVELQAVEVLPL